MIPIEPYPAPVLPSWANPNVSAQDLPQAITASVATLAFLHLCLTTTHHQVPQTLLRNRLCLQAARHSLAIERRQVDIHTLRDALVFSGPNDAAGPDGAMLMQWRKASDVRLTGKAWQTQLLASLPASMGERLADVFAPKACDPVGQATAVLCRVLQANPRQEAIALICANAALSQALGWDHMIPLIRLNRTELRNASDGNDSRLICHHSVAKNAAQTLKQAHDLTARATALRQATPKLRTKGAPDAVALFLREDAVSPSHMLSPYIQGSDTKLTDRSARRFCDRLVTLGLAQELTGRATFRLYGLAG
ncbi:MAG: DUF1403 family protein [Sedimentitalea sp.]